MVDYNGLENRRAERHRGFESLSLRKRSNLRVASFRMRTWFERFLFYLDTEDVEMGYKCHNVRRQVGFDEVVAAKTAATSLGIVPIRAIQNERNELSFF